MKAVLLAILASGVAAGAMADTTSQTQAQTRPGREACARLDTQTVAPDGVRIFKRLNELPWGVLEHAVWRSVGGCPVREIKYEGQTWYVTSNPTRIQKLEPAVPDARQR